MLRGLKLQLYLLSDFFVLFVRVACFTNFLEIECVDVSLLIHKVVAVLTFDLNTSVSFAFVDKGLRHIVTT